MPPTVESSMKIGRRSRSTRVSNRKEPNTSSPFFDADGEGSCEVADVCEALDEVGAAPVSADRPLTVRENLGGRHKPQPSVAQEGCRRRPSLRLGRRRRGRSWLTLRRGCSGRCVLSARDGRHARDQHPSRGYANQHCRFSPKASTAGGRKTSRAPWTDISLPLAVRRACGRFRRYQTATASTAHLAAFPAGRACLVRRPLVSRPFLMRGATALARDFTLLFRRHRGESAALSAFSSSHNGSSVFHLSDRSYS